MNDKVLRFEKLMEDARNCKKCEKILIKRKGQLQDCGLVNFIADATIDGRIPTIWTDWINRLDAAIAIIGQDWGAVSDIEETLKRYRGKVAMAPVGIEPSEVWRQTVREPDSKTNEKLIEFLAASAEQENLQLPEDFVDDIFATNAVLCVRQGKQVRGSANFSASVSIHNCHEFLRRQLEIVEPLVVVTLGEWPLRAVAQIAGFSFDRSLSAMIDKAHNTFGYIMTQRDYVVVPVVHPAAPYPMRTISGIMDSFGRRCWIDWQSLKPSWSRCAFQAKRFHTSYESKLGVFAPLREKLASCDLHLASREVNLV